MKTKSQSYVSKYFSCLLFIELFVLGCANQSRVEAPVNTHSKDEISIVSQSYSRDEIYKRLLAISANSQDKLKIQESSQEFSINLPTDWMARMEKHQLLMTS